MSKPFASLIAVTGTGLSMALLPVMSAAAASVSTPSAFEVTVGDEAFHLIIRNTTFDALQADPDFDLLVPFFGDPALAQEFALQTGDGLGLGSNIIGDMSGPFFVSGEDELADGFEGQESIGFTFFIDSETSLGTTDPLFIQRFAPVDFAVVDLTSKPPVEVPGPALLPGLVGMGLAAMRKRYWAQSDKT